MMQNSKNKISSLSSTLFSSKNFPLWLLGLCLLTYSASLKADFMLDDFDFLNNAYPFKSYKQFFFSSFNQHFQPFFYIINIFLFRVFRHNPFILHLINIILFYVNCLIFYTTALSITKNKKTASLASIFLCLHPINAIFLVQIHYNIVLIYGILIQTSLLLFIHYLQSRSQKKLFLGLSLSTFSLALISFEGAIFFPLFLFNYAFFFQRTKLKKFLRSTSSFLFIIGLYLLLWFKFVWPVTHLKHSQALSMNPFIYTASFFKLISWYCANLFLPFNIALIKNTFPIKEHALFLNIIFVFNLTAVMFLLLKYWKRSIKSFAFLWFVSGCLPVFAAIGTHRYMGFVIEPYWLFFPSMGIFLLAAVILTERKNQTNSKTFLFPAILLCLFLFVCSFKQTSLLKNQEKYLLKWLSISPNNYVLLSNLGNYYANNSQLNKAKEYIEYSLIVSGSRANEAYFNLGAISFRAGDFSRSKQYFYKAKELDPSDISTYVALGWIHEKEDNLSKAENFYFKATQLPGLNLEPKIQLARLYLRTQKDKKAIALIEEILDYKTLNTKKRMDLTAKLIVLYFKNKNISESFRWLEKIRRLKNGSELLLLMIQNFHELKRNDLSFEVCEASIKMFPKNPEFYLWKGVLLANGGHLKKAISVWEMAQQFSPQDKRFQTNITQAQQLLKDSSKP